MVPEVGFDGGDHAAHRPTGPRCPPPPGSRPSRATTAAQPVVVDARVDGDARSFARHAHRDALADPLRGAGDEADPTFESAHSDHRPADRTEDLADEEVAVPDEKRDRVGDLARPDVAPNRQLARRRLMLARKLGRVRRLSSGPTAMQLTRTPFGATSREKLLVKARIVPGRGGVVGLARHACERQPGRGRDDRAAARRDHAGHDGRAGVDRAAKVRLQAAGPTRPGAISPNAAAAWWPWAVTSTEIGPSSRATCVAAAFICARSVTSTTAAARRRSPRSMPATAKPSAASRRPRVRRCRRPRSQVPRAAGLSSVHQVTSRVRQRDPPPSAPHCLVALQADAPPAGWTLVLDPAARVWSGPERIKRMPPSICPHPTSPVSSREASSASPTCSRSHRCPHAGTAHTFQGMVAAQYSVSVVPEDLVGAATDVVPARLVARYAVQASARAFAHLEAPYSTDHDPCQGSSALRFRAASDVASPSRDGHSGTPGPASGTQSRTVSAPGIGRGVPRGATCSSDAQHGPSACFCSPAARFACAPSLTYVEGAHPRSVRTASTLLWEVVA